MEGALEMVFTSLLFLMTLLCIIKLLLQSMAVLFYSDNQHVADDYHAAAAAPKEKRIPSAYHLSIWERLRPNFNKVDT